MSARLDAAVAAVADGMNSYRRSNGADANVLSVSSATWGSLVSMSASNTPVDDVLTRLRSHGVESVLVDGKPLPIGGDS
jgi:hypothetical protein